VFSSSCFEIERLLNWHKAEKPIEAQPRNEIIKVKSQVGLVLLFLSTGCTGVDLLTLWNNSTQLE
jgi:hypothetical protein